MRILILLLICSVFFFSCKSAGEISKPKKTSVSILSSTGLRLFKAETDGPFLIEIEGADVSIKLLKQEPVVENEIEESTKK